MASSLTTPNGYLLAHYNGSLLGIHVMPTCYTKKKLYKRGHIIDIKKWKVYEALPTLVEMLGVQLIG